MKLSRTTMGAVGLALACISFNANAFFFIFIPGSVVRKITDSLTGSEGDNCVSDHAKVGDILTSPTGNTAVIKSLSGTSSICKSDAHPIRALLEFRYSFSPKAGIELPDSFEAKPITPVQTFNGLLLSAHDSSRSIGVTVTSQPHKPGSDGGTLARNVANRMVGVLKDGATSNAEELTVGGLHAYRFRVVGSGKGIFAQSHTYVVTVLVGKDELVQVDAYCPTSDFEKYQAQLEHFAFDVKGLDDGAAPATSSDGDKAADATDKPPAN